jgi:2-oxoglutarate dehydrogenase E2 component (dihydrolipoamide succinyltransferase)
MLKEIPVVNAVIDGGDIVYRDYVDLSVAVSSPRGLVVPVIRNAETLSFKDIELKLAELAVKARADQIAIEDMTGGTFTVSNGGVFGSMMGTPIINPPQSAILGMHATKMRPSVVNVRPGPAARKRSDRAKLTPPPPRLPLPSVQGKVEIRPIMYLALTYDHRLVDGREAVTFLCGVRDKVEDPRRLLLGL